MDMDLSFILELPVFTAFWIVLAAILVKTFFGVILAIKAGEFDIRKPPQFLATNVVPYVGGMAILAFVTHLVGGPFGYLFYAVALAVLAKYLAEIKDKVQALFDIDLE